MVDRFGVDRPAGHKQTAVCIRLHDEQNNMHPLFLLLSTAANDHKICQDRALPALNGMEQDHAAEASVKQMAGIPCGPSLCQSEKTQAHMAAASSCP